MSNAEPAVLVEQHGTVQLITWNRPEKLNAWSIAIEDQYFAALTAAEADPDIRAIVVTGAGRGFCAGADMEDLSAAPTATDEEIDRPLPRHYPLTIRKPMIAAVNGAAAGLGFVEALYADIRFVSPKAKFISAFVRRGLIAEYGVSWILPRLVGTSRALDILLSGRTIDGIEAERMGLADRLVEPDDLIPAAIAYAEEIGTWCSPTSLSLIKQQVFDDFERSFVESVDTADHLMRESFKAADINEGVQSFLERRPPQFSPLDLEQGAHHAV